MRLKSVKKIFKNSRNRKKSLKRRSMRGGAHSSDGYDVFVEETQKFNDLVAQPSTEAPKQEDDDPGKQAEDFKNNSEKILNGLYSLLNLTSDEKFKMKKAIKENPITQEMLQRLKDYKDKLTPDELENLLADVKLLLKGIPITISASLLYAADEIYNDLIPVDQNPPKAIIHGTIILLFSRLAKPIDGCNYLYKRLMKEVDVAPNIKNDLEKIILAFEERVATRIAEETSKKAEVASEALLKKSRFKF